MCDVCYPYHRKHSPMRKHSMKPIGTLPYHQIPGYYDRLKLRDEAFPKVRETLLGNVTAVETLIGKVEGQIETIIAAFRTHSETVLADLRGVREELKTELEAALDEVAITLLEDQPIFLSKYGPLVRHCLITDTPPIFSGQLASPALDPRSLLSVTYSLTNDFTRYPYFSETDLSIYQIPSQSVLQYPLPAGCSSGSTFCLLNPSSALYIGGLDRAAHVLCLETGENQSIGFMTVARQDAGLAKARSAVYVFGGHDGFGPMVECEKFSLQKKTWASLPPMKYPRSEFCPCVHHNDIYLVSTCSSTHRALETFNLVSECFQVLEATIPEAITLSVTSVALISQGCLVVLTGGKQQIKWRLAEWKAEVRETTQAAWNTCLPLVVGSEALMTGKTALIRFNLETEQFRE